MSSPILNRGAWLTRHYAPSQKWSTRKGPQLAMIQRRFFTKIPTSTRQIFRRSTGKAPRKLKSGPGHARYYSGGSFSSSQSATNVVRTVIGINGVIFGLWQYATWLQHRSLYDWLQRNFTLNGLNINDGRWYTLITSTFSHGSFFHFAFNMIALNAFGTIISFVPGVGAVHVISLFVGSGIAGSVAWLYHLKSQRSSRGSQLPQLQQRVVVRSALGASGMVMGAGAAATCLMPMAPMMIMLVPITIPLWVVTTLYFGVDAYYLSSDSRVGHAAHLGGAMYGAAYYILYLRKYGGIWRFLRRGIR